MPISVLLHFLTAQTFGLGQTDRRADGQEP